MVVVVSLMKHTGRRGRYFQLKFLVFSTKPFEGRHVGETLARLSVYERSLQERFTSSQGSTGFESWPGLIKLKPR
jgi:hypothetical protein